MARRKSFKKSLRESFRRLRSRRSDRGGRRRTQAAGVSPRTPSAHNRASPVNSPRRGAGGGGGTPGRQWQQQQQGADMTLDPGPDSSPRPVERAVEARSADDVSGSIVRTLYFTDTFLVSNQQHTPSLWAGTNAGSVFAFQITVPSIDRRETEQVQCILAKEIHLRHHAPVVGMCVLDRNFYPVPATLDVQHERAKPADMSGAHSIIICSEEQLKVFSLPSLSGKDKFKLTAHEGTKIRKANFVNFCSRNDGSYVESDLVCLTNQGDIHIYSVPHLRRQLRTDCIKKDNVIGIVSSVFTQKGEGFYLISPSELVRFSVSAQVQRRPVCIVRPPNQSALPRAIATDARLLSAAASTATPPKNLSRGTENVEATADVSAEDTSVLSDGGHLGGTTDDSIASGDTTADSVRVYVSASPASNYTTCQRTITTKTTTTRANWNATSETTGIESMRSEMTTLRIDTTNGQSTHQSESRQYIQQAASNASVH